MKLTRKSNWMLCLLAISSLALAPIRAGELFNGHNLAGWSTYLVDTKNDDPRRVFTVTNGLIRISGDGLGYLATERRFTNYHLTLEYRWGTHNSTWGDRVGKARDSGVFLHASGPDGNSDDGKGAFMAAIECNVFEGAVGDFLLIRGKNEKGEPIAPRVTTNVAPDRDADGWYTWSESGQQQTIERWGRVNWRKKDPEWRDVLGFRGREDVERPGWNRLECICRDGTIEVRLNGVVVNRAREVWPQSGRILLQCEGSEIFFRRVSVDSPGLSIQPLFPFCIDWHDARKRTMREQAAMLKELGFEGMGHVYLDKLEERLQTLDEAGLKLFQVIMEVDLAPGNEPYDRRFDSALKRVNGRGVQFCLLFKGGRASDIALDDRAVRIIRDLSEKAGETDARLLLYPHEAAWIERIEDAVRVAEKVDRPNVGVIFNLCHWLRVDKSRDYQALLKRARPLLWAVSLNGADNFDEKPGWDRYIQPLDSGSFDLAAFLRALDELEFRGPIGLQCYGIGGDAKTHLSRSLNAWKKLRP